MTLFRCHPALLRGLLTLMLCLGLFCGPSAAQTTPAQIPSAQAPPAAHATSSAVQPGGDLSSKGPSAGPSAPGKAAGNGSSSSGKAEGVLVAEVLLLLLVGRVLGEGMQRIGQPPLMGQLLAGIVLGPSLFGWVWPQAQHFLFPADPAQKGMIDGLSQIGILMLLLLTGMETDLKLVRKSGFAAIAIALCGIAFPFACGFLLGQFGPSEMFGSGDRLVPSLFLGTALSISSISEWHGWIALVSSMSYLASRRDGSRKCFLSKGA